MLSQSEQSFLCSVDRALGKRGFKNNANSNLDMEIKEELKLNGIKTRFVS